MNPGLEDALITSRIPLLIVVAAILTLGLTHNLLSSSPFVIAAQFVAIGTSVWARRSFPKGAFRVAAGPGAQAVIRRGPYRIVRHPMYAATLLFIWATILGHPSLLNVAIGATVTLVVASRVVAEERLLRAHYPDYDEYARAVKAVVPFVV